jgi:two-component system, NtrC family, sensor kinase
MHSLLKRQLKKHTGVSDPLPQELGAFVDAVNGAYEQFDADRAMLERTLELNNRDLNNLLRENRLQMEALGVANARLALVNNLFRELAGKAKMLHASRDYRAFYRKVLTDVRRLVAARYGAVGLISETGDLVDFIVEDMDSVEVSTIGRLPEGRGPLAAVHREKRVIRVDNITNDPRSCGVPGNVTMTSFVGVPLIVNGSVLGALYLTDKNGGEPFTDEDEVMLDMYTKELAHILDRQRLMESFEETGANLQSLIDNNPCILYRRLPAGNYAITFVSEHIVSLFDYLPADVVRDKECWLSRVHPDDRASIQACFRRAIEVGETVQEYRFRHRNGCYRWVRDNVRVLKDPNGKPTQLIGFVADVTERKQYEEELRQRHEELQESNRRLEEAHNQLLQSEKMAAIGQLAAGVAHEINNPVGYVSSNLTTMKGYVENLLQIMDVYSSAEYLLSVHKATSETISNIKKSLEFDYIKKDLPDLLRESLEGISRVSEIVTNLKAFSRIDTQELQWSDLHKGMEATLSIVNNELKYKATVIKEYGDIPQIECRLAQINQVFMNLLVNAVQAIEDTGTIWIRTAGEGSWVWVEIEDTGKGIPPEHMNRIFDPFFTTKPVGKGTGLGLSLSYGIIDKHGGHFEIESKVGRGTRFRIWLPIQSRPSGAKVVGA